jgi:hypothetical protein
MLEGVGIGGRKESHPHMLLWRKANKNSQPHIPFSLLTFQQLGSNDFLVFVCCLCKWRNFRSHIYNLLNYKAADWTEASLCELPDGAGVAWSLQFTFHLPLQIPSCSPSPVFSPDSTQFLCCRHTEQFMPHSQNTVAPQRPYAMHMHFLGLSLAFFDTISSTSKHSMAFYEL